MVDEVVFKICWSKVHEIPTRCSAKQFLHSAKVWMDKPHVVNRRLSGSLTLKRVILSYKYLIELSQFVLSTPREANDVCSKIDSITNEDNSLNAEETSVLVVVRRLLPRLMAKSDKLVELVLVDEIRNEVLFIPICTEKPQQSSNQETKSSTPMVPYKFSFMKTSGNELSKIILSIPDDTLESYPTGTKGGDGVVCPSINWLKDHLLKKISKWAENPEMSSKGSLRLISLEKYTLMYQSLKEKYGFDLVKRWPENTDPQKFVFEDIAIATYLIILWEAEQEQNKLTKKQSFVDLGCGNGLLVYILCKEGERSLDPTKGDLFPEVDWLIGNHSDELTPWIPVMAARSSYHARYFVLPCCFYDFNCKYARTNNKLSQYHGYLEFVANVGVTCGFNVEEDMLRIPSTKRICHIGQTRAYKEELQELINNKIKNFVAERGCDIDSGQKPQTMSTKRKYSFDEDHEDRTKANDEYLCSNNTDELSVSDSEDSSPKLKKVALDSTQLSSSTFQPREHKIDVKNCSQLSKSLREHIVETVVQGLLKKDSQDCWKGDTNRKTSTGKLVSEWTKGSSMSLAEVAHLFDKDTLKQLKNECGGIQTLLRNHRFIFKVLRGRTELQDWRDQVPGPKLVNGDHKYLKKRYDALRNTSPCWFHLNHPEGCVLQTEQCPYAHSEQELVERPSQEYLQNL